MKLTEHKYERQRRTPKITVKYIINTHLKPDIDKRTGDLLYPLYVTISVNRQLTQFKSRLNNYIPADELDVLLNHPIHKRYIDNERSIIEQTVLKQNPDNVADFKIKNWSAYYESGLSLLIDMVNHRLLMELFKILGKHKLLDYDDFVRTGGTMATALSLLAKLSIEEAKGMQYQYNKLIDFRVYLSLIYYKHQTAYDFSLWDYENGFFQSILHEVVPLEATEIIEQIDSLLSL